ncbi:MAG TPA: DNA primase [Candidatus Acidoferrales bacterium]|nr:DNA primase [Candidatus Acidoferrales bacterium]
MSGPIPQEFIDEVLARSDLVALVERRIPLRKAGRDFTALCPFHDEKTPSFTVSPEKQFYHCFGCGAHGNAIGFLMAFDRLEFRDAVADLAAEAGLTMPVGGETPPARHLELQNVLQAVARYFRQQLRDTPKAIDYLKSRGLSGATAATFGIGYAPARWDAVLRQFGATAEQRALLLECGLIIPREGSEDGFYDRFRDRIVFPIRDGRGRVIGFGGRVLDDGQPKYINSPETLLFHKGQELYGLYEARQAERELPWVLVVEGYMDVLMLAEHGITNAVATLGTAATPEHLRRLFRYTRRIVFCFDGDGAGRTAAVRALNTSLPEMLEGREIAFLFLPEAEDPDSLVRREGHDGFLARTQQALPLSDFLLQQLKEGLNVQTIEGRTRLLERGRSTFKKIPNGIFRQLLEQALAQLAKTDVGNVRAGFDRRASAAPPRPSSATRTQPTPLQRLTGLILAHPPAAAWIDPGIPPLLRTGGDEAEWLLALIELARERPHLTSGGLLERFRSHPAEPLFAELLAWQPNRSEDGLARECSDICRYLLMQASKAELDGLLAKAATAALDEREKQRLRYLLARREA